MTRGTLLSGSLTLGHLSCLSSSEDCCQVASGSPGRDKAGAALSLCQGLGAATSLVTTEETEEGRQLQAPLELALGVSGWKRIMSEGKVWPPCRLQEWLPDTHGSPGWRILKPARFSSPMAPLCLASNPGFSLHDGLGEVQPIRKWVSGWLQHREGAVLSGSGISLNRPGPAFSTNQLQTGPRS